LVSYGITTQKTSVWNIRLYLKEMELKGVDWIHLAQDRDQWQVVVNTVMSLRFL
jgi:hypothetical protein